MNDFLLQDWQRAAITDYVNEIRDRYAAGDLLPEMVSDASYVTLAVVSATLEAKHSPNPKPRMRELLAILELKFALPPEYLAAAVKIIKAKINLLVDEG